MDKKKKFNRSICFHGTQSIREMLKGKCDRKEAQSRKRNNLLEGEPLVERDLRNSILASILQVA